MSTGNMYDVLNNLISSRFATCKGYSETVLTPAIRETNSLPDHTDLLNSSRSTWTRDDFMNCCCFCRQDSFRGKVKHQLCLSTTGRQGPFCTKSRSTRWMLPWSPGGQNGSAPGGPYPKGQPSRSDASAWETQKCDPVKIEAKPSANRWQLKHLSGWIVDEPRHVVSPLNKASKKYLCVNWKWRHCPERAKRSICLASKRSASGGLKQNCNNLKFWMGPSMS